MPTKRKPGRPKVTDKPNVVSLLVVWNHKNKPTLQIRTQQKRPFRKGKVSFGDP